MELPDIVIPSKIAWNKNISLEMRFFYGYILFLCGTNGYTRFSNSKLIKAMNVSDRTVTYWLTELEKNGLVNRKMVRFADGVKRTVFLADHDKVNMPSKGNVVVSFARDGGRSEREYSNEEMQAIDKMLDALDALKK